MPDQPEPHEFSTAEIVAMKYAFHELLREYPERYPGISEKQQLARSVINSMANIRLGPVNDLSQLVTVIMEDDDV